MNEKIIKFKEKVIKNKKSVIISIIVVIILLLLIVLLNVFKKEDDKKKYNLDYTNIDNIFFSDEVISDPDRVYVSNDDLSKQQCVNDFCVSDVFIVCYNNRGNINYSIVNKSDKTRSAYLKMIIDDKTSYIILDKLKPNKKYSSVIGYDGYDFRKVKNYKLEIMSIGEREAFVK